MAAATQERDKAGQADLTLSPTFQTTQLLTPRYLQRITIDDPHYGRYLDHAVQTEPPQRHPVHCRTKKAGDRFFFVHRDIPVHQQYTRTPLSLSVNRHWDQGAPRPLSSSQILEKELHLPFPAQHPYASHISHFAVFPSTRAGESGPARDTHTGESWHLKNTGTQTPVRPTTAPSVSAPPTPYYVASKASSATGVRVEQRQLALLEGWDARERGQLWDLPRSQRHRRAHTYPAPALQYPTRTTPALSAHTRAGLDTVNRLLAWTTTYGEHFPGHGGTGPQNLVRLDLSMCSHGRPYTAESRGKYFRGSSCSAKERYGVVSEEEEEEEGTIDEVFGRDPVEMVDRATQTDFEDADSEHSPDKAGQLKLPEISPSTPHNVHSQHSCTAAVTLPLPPNGAADLVTKPPSVTTGNRPLTSDERPLGTREEGYTPRSALSAKRMAALYEFNKTDVLKNFHSQFPEQVPDLRDNSIREGKRHVIHGHHAYYFH